MVISFEITDHYVLVTYTGQMNFAEFTAAWKGYYESDRWVPGLNVLNNLSAAKFSETTVKEIRSVVDFDKVTHGEHGRAFKVAHYVPEALQYGMVQVYTAIDKETPGTHKIFQDIQKAKTWLAEM